MRLTHLHAESFGILQDLRLEDLPAGLLVVSGDNEAGKSTLLAFLRSVLFGFPRKNAAQERSYPALGGGVLGGRIGLCFEDGRELEVERFYGRHGSRARLLHPDGSVDGGGDLEALLGVNALTYKTVFAFDLADLVRLREEREEIQSILFGAASGSGHLALPRAEKALADRARELFAPRSRKARINRGFRELTRIGRELAEARRQADVYEELRREIVGRQADVDRLQKALRVVRLDKALLDRRSRVFPDFLELRDIDARLGEAGGLADTFPEDAAARWRRLSEEIDRLDLALNERLQELEPARREQEASAVDATLLENEEALRGLTARLEGARRDYERRRELRILLEEGDRSIAGDLAALGPDFHLDWIAEADPSLFARDEVRRLGLRLRELERGLDDLRQRREEKERQLGALARAGGSPAEPKPEAAEGPKRYRRWVSAEDLQHARERHRELGDQLRRLEALRVRLEQTTRKAASVERPPPSFELWRRLLGAGLSLLALGLIGAAGAAWLGFLGPPAWALAGLALVGLAVLVVGLFLRPPAAPPKGAPDSSDTTDWEEEIETLHDDAARTLRDLGSDEEPSWQQWHEVAARLQEAAIEMVRLEGRENRLLELEGELEPLRAQQAQREEWLAEARRDWQRWIASRGFPRELSPETAIDTLERIEKLQRLLEERESRRDEAALLVEKRDHWNGEVASVFDRVSRDVPDRATQLAAVESLGQELEEARRKEELAKQQGRALARLEERISADRRQLEELRAQAAELLEQTGAADGDELLRLAESCAEEQELKRRRGELHQQILRHLEVPSFEAAEKLFEGEDRSELDRLAAELEEKEEALESELEEARRERLSLEHGLADLASSEDVAILRNEEESWAQSVREDAEDWARVVLANFLIGRARSVYEREHQPQVLQTASRYFATITEGRYPKLLAPLGEEEIYLVDEAGRRKSSQELSRGTEEQLYLALRFGFVSQLAEDRETLPIVMDDILVNSDASRARRAAAAIAELSKDHQVLYFTCHPHTLDLFREATSDVVELALVAGALKQPGS